MEGNLLKLEGQLLNDLQKTKKKGYLSDEMYK